MMMNGDSMTLMFRRRNDANINVNTIATGRNRSTVDMPVSDNGIPSGWIKRHIFESHGDQQEANLTPQSVYLIGFEET